VELRGSKSKYCDKVGFISKHQVDKKITGLYKKHPTMRMRSYFCDIHRAWHITTTEGMQEFKEQKDN
jgi:hypothetical protein